MATSGPSVDSNMGVGGIISSGIDVVTDDLRISGLQLIGTLLSMIPIIGSILQLVIGGLAIQFADETIGNPEPDQSILIRALKVILTAIVMVLVIGIGLVFLILPGIYFSLKFALAIPAVWIGGKGPIEALGESWSRTGGHLFTIFGVGLVFALAALVVFVPAFMVFFPFGSAEAIQQLNAQPLVFASPPLFAVSTMYAVTVGAVGVATQAIMYRSFGTGGMPSGPSSADTQF